MNLMKLSADALLKLRTDANLTQENMAEEMDKIRQSTYCRLENEKTKITMQHISKIAKAVGKSTEDVFSKLSGCTVSTTNSDTAQYNQNIGVYVSDNELIQQLLAEKDRYIASQEAQLKANAIAMNLIQAENERLQKEIERLKNS